MQGSLYPAVAGAASLVPMPRQVLCCLCFPGVSTGDGSPALASPPRPYLCLKLASSLVLQYGFSSETTLARRQLLFVIRTFLLCSATGACFRSKNSCISTAGFVCSWNIPTTPVKTPELIRTGLTCREKVSSTQVPVLH